MHSFLTLNLYVLVVFLSRMSKMDVLILRVEAADSIVVQVCSTGAVVSVKLNAYIPLHQMGIARLVTPYSPVGAKLVFGTFQCGEQTVYNCKLEPVKWPKPVGRPRMPWF
jgi:hypothetical protein